MAQIKKVIESLCQVLNSFGFSECLAEDFRLCKYNKPEPVAKHKLKKSQKVNNFSLKRLRKCGSCFTNLFAITITKVLSKVKTKYLIKFRQVIYFQYLKHIKHSDTYICFLKI